MKPLHIDDDVTIRTDEEARRALATENDTAYISARAGITRVPLERWQKAQKAEHKHWMVRSRHVSNDRNDIHMAMFDSYASLRNRRFAHALELGCGPFTNLSLIANLCQIESVSLLDPLIESYLKHDFCNYTRDRLYVRRGGLDALLRATLGRAWPGLYRLLVRGLFPPRSIPIRQQFALPIEQMPTPQTAADLLVIINVIEHCYDIETVFRSILAALAPDGWLVFHDRYYDHEQVAQSVRHWYDAAHPLKVDRHVLDSFLQTHFEPVYQRIDTEHFTFKEIDFSFDTLYYIGRRR